MSQIQVRNYTDFMSKVTKKMAKLFNQLTKLCIKECNNAKKNKITRGTQFEEEPQINVHEQNDEELNIQPQEEQEKISQDQHFLSDESSISQSSQDIDKTNINSDEGQNMLKNSQIMGQQISFNHDDRPKKPQSSFLLFFNDFRKNIQPGEYEKTNLSLIASQKWKQLSDAQRQPYDRKSKIMRRIYQEKMKKYRLEHAGQIQRDKISRKIKNKLINKLKAHRFKAKQQQLKIKPNGKSQDNYIQDMNIVVLDDEPKTYNYF